MISLLDALARAQDISIAVVTAWPGTEDSNFEENGVNYFIIGQPKGFSHFAFRQRDMRRSLDILSSWQPDIVHIHGTERFYGLLSSQDFIKAPLVISIQGLLGRIVPYFFGRMSLSEIIGSHRISQFIRGYGLLPDYLRAKSAAYREADIIKTSKSFLGRTRWDRAQIAALNPFARYYYVSEPIRDVFHKKEWNLSRAARHSIIFTNARSPLRNIETLLEALRLLSYHYPGVSLKLAGNIDVNNGYGKHLSKLIDKYHLSDKVAMLGYLNEHQMVEHMLMSHVFCNSSFIENSPNSLCEAQVLGMPCVGSYAGGIPSIIEDGTSGLLFPASDPALLADAISRIFSDDDFAESLGHTANQIARERHDADHIVKQLLSSYSDIIRRHQNEIKAPCGA